MSLLKARLRTSVAAGNAPERDPKLCGATGCPVRGSVDLGGSSRYCCAWHAWAKPEKWPAITEALLQHDWLRDFITDLMSREELFKDAEWRNYAMQFWANDPECRPGHEDGRPETRDLYLRRMNQELHFRVGTRKDRPPIRVPAPVSMGPRLRLPISEDES